MHVSVGISQCRTVSLFSVFFSGLGLENSNTHVFFQSLFLLYFPNGNFSIVFGGSTKNITILSRAKSCHLVTVSVKLL